MITALVGLFGTLLGVLITLSGQWFMASRQQKNLFRLAALDKRLEIHQQAFTLWQELVSVVHKEPERTAVVLKCQAWWYENCLYLDPKVRDAFRWCFMGVWNYDGKDKEMREKVWPKIMAPGNLIQAAVDLPAIGDLEAAVKGLERGTDKP